MKPILVPTDFSKSAYNAVKYAIELAKVSKAKIILLHIYQIPTPPPVGHVSSIPILELHKESMKRLKEMADFELKLNKEESNLEIQCEAREGLIVGNIIEAAEKYNAGMIAMGTQGASGVIKKYILGSNTANIIAKSSFPVLAVPENAKYLGLKRFILAADVHEIKNNSSLDTLVEIALLFDSEILILSVLKDEKDIPSVSQAFERANLDKVLERVPHSFHSVVSKDIVDVIDKFTISHNSDLLVTMPQKHNYFELIFNKSITRNLVFHTQIPILALPEQS